jgi:hypothetical protein
LAKKLAFLTQNKANLYKMLIITSVFEKNANFFRRKLSKIAENCDHNIDPWLSHGTFVADVEAARWRQKNRCPIKIFGRIRGSILLCKKQQLRPKFQQNLRP